ncbi:MAG: Hfq-like protein [Janthinobacterium lividum]
MEISELERLRGMTRPEERLSPREVELIKYRDNRTMIAVTLMNGETMEGAIRWHDHMALRMVQADRTEVTISLHAIAYYRPRL